MKVLGILLLYIAPCLAFFSSLSGTRTSSIRHAQLAMKISGKPGNIMTLSRFMIEATRSNPDHADLESLMMSIQIACKTIADIVSRNGVFDLAGHDPSSDASGKHMELYEMANEVLKNSLRFSGKIGMVIPEEETENPVLIDEAWNSKYCAVFDPLDGSSNIDLGVVAGTIFGIFKEEEECLMDFGEDVSAETKEALARNLKTKNLVASGYCMYSSSVVLMMSLGEGVHGFTLDPNIGEFVLTHPNVKIPRRGRMYSFNEANMYKWPKGMQRYVNDIKLGRGELGASYTSRYIGSLVGDFHRTLLQGGIFGYPADSKRPRGKLRLLHEVGPMAFLVEQAGGLASTGFEPIMSVNAQSLDEHVPTFLGSYEDVREVEKYLATDVCP